MIFGTPPDQWTLTIVSVRRPSITIGGFFHIPQHGFVKERAILCVCVCFVCVCVHICYLEIHGRMASLVHGLIGVFSLAILCSYGVFNTSKPNCELNNGHEIHATCPCVMRLSFCEFMLVTM